jgi:hypothetical protein
MQDRTRSWSLIPLTMVFGACALSFVLGYFIRGLKTMPVNVSLTTQDDYTEIPNKEGFVSPLANTSDFESLLATIEETIDPDKWLAAGETSTIMEYPSNMTACTIEDIFGSREAFLEILDGSNAEEFAAEHPFRTSADDDPFNSSVQE